MATIDDPYTIVFATKAEEFEVQLRDLPFIGMRVAFDAESRYEVTEVLFDFAAGIVHAKVSGPVKRNPEPQGLRRVSMLKQFG